MRSRLVQSFIRFSHVGQTGYDAEAVLADEHILQRGAREPNDPNPDGRQSRGQDDNSEGISQSDAHASIHEG